MKSKVSITKVKFNAGGYAVDFNHKYFGGNDPVNGTLYVAQRDGLDAVFFRARNRADAKASFLAMRAKMGA